MRRGSGTGDLLLRVRAELEPHAHVFDDPRSYLAGIDDALAQVRMMLGEPSASIVVDELEEAAP